MMEKFTKKTTARINVQIYAEFLVSSYYSAGLALNSIDSNKNEPVSDYFIEVLCDIFDKMMKLNAEFNCFDDEISKILDFAYKLVYSYENGIDDKAADALTEMEMNLYNHICESL